MAPEGEKLAPQRLRRQWFPGGPPERTRALLGRHRAVRVATQSAAAPATIDPLNFELKMLVSHGILARTERLPGGVGLCSKLR